MTTSEVIHLIIRFLVLDFEYFVVSMFLIIFLVLFAANRFALTKLASMGWRNVGTKLKIPPVEHINIC